MVLLVIDERAYP